MGVVEYAIALARQRFPEATAVRVDEFEIAEDCAYVSLSIKLAPSCPALLEIKFTEPKENA
jgi:hypothetical protein